MDGSAAAQLPLVDASVLTNTFLTVLMLARAHAGVVDVIGPELEVRLPCALLVSQGITPCMR